MTARRYGQTPMNTPAFRLGVGQRLKEARLRLGLSQQEAADRFGLSRVAVAMHERGASSPLAAKLAHACLVYGVTADWLLFGEAREVALAGAA